VTLWILLLGMYLGIYAVVLALNAAVNTPLSTRDVVALAGGAAGLVVTAAILRGVWRMKPWSRSPAIALHTVLLLLFGYSEARSGLPDSTESFFERTGGLIWLGALVVVIVWLATHRAEFHYRPHVAPYPDDERSG
jgi:hypothetical protein